MLPDVEAEGGRKPPRLMIPEIRDYQRINAALVALLDRGHPRVCLDGAEGQRLLASGLRGNWSATVEIVGRTGPETAANLDAPGLTVIANGPTADGVGQGLAAGRILIRGDAGDVSGYAQSGGLLVVLGSAGHRSGLWQSGGILAILGEVGRLAGECQSGGRFFLPSAPIGPHASRGQTGGRVIADEVEGPIDPDDHAAWREVRNLVALALAPPSSLPS